LSFSIRTDYSLLLKTGPMWLELSSLA
jgi:hypothetical protein